MDNVSTVFKLQKSNSSQQKTMWTQCSNITTPQQFLKQSILQLCEISRHPEIIKWRGRVVATTTCTWWIWTSTISSVSDPTQYFFRSFHTNRWTKGNNLQLAKDLILLHISYKNAFQRQDTTKFDLILLMKQTYIFMRLICRCWNTAHWRHRQRGYRRWNCFNWHSSVLSHVLKLNYTSCT